MWHAKELSLINDHDKNFYIYYLNCPVKYFVFVYVLKRFHQKDRFAIGHFFSNSRRHVTNKLYHNAPWYAENIHNVGSVSRMIQKEITQKRIVSYSVFLLLIVRIMLLYRNISQKDIFENVY